jgi:hypothetical protein
MDRSEIQARVQAYANRIFRAAEDAEKRILGDLLFTTLEGYESANHSVWWAIYVGNFRDILGASAQVELAPWWEVPQEVVRELNGQEGLDPQRQRFLRIRFADSPDFEFWLIFYYDGKLSRSLFAVYEEPSQPSSVSSSQRG